MHHILLGADLVWAFHVDQLVISPDYDHSVKDTCYLALRGNTLKMRRASARKKSDRDSKDHWIDQGNER